MPVNSWGYCEEREYGEETGRRVKRRIKKHAKRKVIGLMYVRVGATNTTYLKRV